MPLINAASSADKIRFLILNKDLLKRNVHEPLIEFILNNELNFSGDKPPFVVSTEKQKNILHEYEMALSLNINKEIKRLFSNHFTQLNKELSDNKLKNEQREKFSMHNFLSQDPDPYFSERIRELLVKRANVPPFFSVEKYLHFNPDVKAVGVDPYMHFLKYGIKEGRRIG